MERIALNLLKYLLARQCGICFQLQSDDNICFNCFKNFSFLQGACKKCQQPFEYAIEGVEICEMCEKNNVQFYSQMICALKYNEFVKNLVVRFKNGSAFYLSKIFAKFIKNAAGDLSEYSIVPIPLYKDRLIWRGYNQSLILARAMPWPVLDNIVVRIKDTNSQSTKTIQERKDNMCNAFFVQKNVQGKKLIILDDVITTGATVFECAKVLSKAGAEDVKIMSLARRLRKPRV